MTDAPWTAATELHRTLVEHGVVVLAVIADRTEAGWFTVYLHGPAGNYQQTTALEVLRRLPGVSEVRVSDWSSDILRVRQVPGVPN
jgi:hypothetical protein